MKTQKYAIFDIDGCCVDISARLPYLVDGDHETFQSMWTTDKPIEAGVAVYTSLMMAGFHGVFLTARNIALHGITLQQLRPLFPNLPFTLLMAESANDDHAKYKVDQLNSFLKRNNATLDDVLVCFDDNLAVIEAYRNIGLTAYLTDEGWK